MKIYIWLIRIVLFSHKQRIYFSESPQKTITFRNKTIILSQHQPHIHVHLPWPSSGSLFHDSPDFKTPNRRRRGLFYAITPARVYISTHWRRNKGGYHAGATHQHDVIRIYILVTRERASHSTGYRARRKGERDIFSWTTSDERSFFFFFSVGLSAVWFGRFEEWW